jgi:hypothetical protein
LRFVHCVIGYQILVISIDETATPSVLEVASRFGFEYHNPEPLVSTEVDVYTISDTEPFIQDVVGDMAKGLITFGNTDVPGLGMHVDPPSCPRLPPVPISPNGSDAPRASSPNKKQKQEVVAGVGNHWNPHALGAHFPGAPVGPSSASTDQPVPQVSTNDLATLIQRQTIMFQEALAQQNSNLQHLLARDGQIQADLEALKTDFRCEAAAIRNDLGADIVSVKKTLQDKEDCLRRDFEALKLLVTSSSAGPSGLGPPGPGASGSRGAPRAPAPPVVTRGQPQQFHFVPDRLFLRGWSPFVRNEAERKSQGLSEEQCQDVANTVLKNLPREFRDMIEFVRAPYYRNHQIALLLRESVTSDQAFAVSRRLNDLIKSSGIKVGGSAIYCTVDNPPWKKERNSALARAESGVLPHVLQDVVLTKDWASGELWARFQGSDISIGKYNSRAGSFKWFDAVLNVTNPNTTMMMIETSCAHVK